MIAEWNQVYPNIELCLDLLYTFNNEFFLDDAKAEYARLESAILSAQVENDDLVRQFLDSSTEILRDRNIKQFLKVCAIVRSRPGSPGIY